MFLPMNCDVDRVSTCQRHHICSAQVQMSSPMRYSTQDAWTSTRLDVGDGFGQTTKWCSKIFLGARFTSCAGLARLAFSVGVLGGRDTGEDVDVNLPRPAYLGGEPPQFED